MNEKIEFSIGGQVFQFIKEINSEGMPIYKLTVKMSHYNTKTCFEKLLSNTGLSQEQKKVTWPERSGQDWQFSLTANYFQDIVSMCRIFSKINNQLKDLLYTSRITLADYLRLQNDLFKCKEKLDSSELPVCSLHVMSDFPINLQSYENSYILKGNRLQDYELKYIKSDGKAEDVQIADYNKFMTTLNNINKAKSETVVLTNIQIDSLLTSNVGHASAPTTTLKYALAEFTPALPHVNKITTYTALDNILDVKIKYFIENLDKYIKEREGRENRKRTCFDFFTFYDRELSNKRYILANQIRDNLNNLLSGGGTEELKVNQLITIIVEARKQDIQYAIEHDKDSAFSFKRSKLNQLFIQPACDYLVEENFIYARDLTKDALKPQVNPNKIACCVQ